MKNINKILNNIKNKIKFIFKTKKKKILFYLLLISLIIIPLSFFFLKKQASASWWNDSWFYRKSIPITNSGSLQNNVYVTLSLDTSDTTKFQTDCGDIRFIQNNGKSLPYFIASGCGTATTSVHINFDALSIGTQNVDFYYGNPTADNGFSATDFSTAAITFAVGTFGTEEKGPSPVLYLPFDEGYGTTAHDESSNHNDGTITGATWKDTSDCKNGKCLEFDGSGDYVEVADNNSLDLSNELTLEAWVKPQTTNLNNQTILSKVEKSTGPTKIFRSVGPSATTAITTGTTNAMTIVGDRATFATALADNIGVGDAIQYDVDNDGDIDASDKIVFISGRVNSKEYIVKTNAGGLPSAVVSDNDWSLFRAYTTLANAETGTENTGIDADLVNFDSWSGGRDIVASNEQWNIACYGNGATADTNAVSISGWTTGVNNFINIYTPTNSSEVGISQRHTGKWDTNKYRLETNSNNNSLGMGSSDYLAIDGLQIKNSYTNRYVVAAGYVSGILTVKNSIIQGNSQASSGIYGLLMDCSTSGKRYVYNNIVYNLGTVNTTCYYAAGGGSHYYYNNTCYGANVGYHVNTATQYANLQNNVAQQNVIGYENPSYIDVSLNNLSGDATATGTGSKINQTVSFISTTSGSEDFHLSPTDTAAKNSGVDLSSDNSFPFASDIDGGSRSSVSSPQESALWDIGADEAQATQIYRSVAPNKTDALETGSSGLFSSPNNSLTIVGSTATFARALVDNIGVGDVIQYDDDNDGDIDTSDSLAFITGRISNFEFQISNASGGTAVPVNSDNDWSIFRAYTSLSNAEAGTENTGIDSDLRNFDTWSGGKDIVSSKEQWNIACYGNGTTTDTAYVEVNGWTTEIQNFVKIYTPVSSSEVGISQRHNGKWDNNKYRLSVDGHAFENWELYTVVDGLQIEEVSTGSRNVASLRGSSYFLNNIVKGNNQGVSTVGIVLAASGSYFYIYNNIVYNITGPAITDSSGSGGFGFIYNNTIFNCGIGANLGTKTNSSILKNNLFSNNTNDALGTFANGSDYNATSKASLEYTVTGGGNTHDKLNQTFAFISTTSGSEDLHLTSTDTAARNAGVDLSADANLPIKTDIDSQRRDDPVGRLYDIGADEAIATKIYRSVGPSNTSTLATDENHENTVSVSSGVATFEEAMPARVGVGDAVLIDTNSDNAITSADTLLFIKSRTDNTHYTLQTHTGAVPADIAVNDTYQIYRAYTSLFDAEAGTKNTSIPIAFNGGSRDLVTNNEEWNIACYGDAVDTTGVTVNGWTTGVENLIKIYTPTSSSEVGITQRHSGKWDNGKYQLIVTDTPVDVRDNYVSIDGLQARRIANAVSNPNAISYMPDGAAGAGGDIFLLSNSILELGSMTGESQARGVYLNFAGAKMYVWNNIITGWKPTSGASAYALQGSNGDAYIYNNVVYDNYYGIRTTSGSLVKNNAVFNNFDDFYSVTAGIMFNNASDDGDGTNPVIPVDWNTVFRDVTNKDFHLLSSDTNLTGKGLNLSGSQGFDPLGISGSNPLMHDIEGELRPDLGTDAINRVSTEAWDIGADQISDITHNNYSLNLNTNYPQTNFSTGNNDKSNFSSGNVILPTDKWSHLVYKRNADSEELFINGSKKDSGTISNLLKSNGGKLYLGAQNSSSENSFKGLIDEVRIYNYARTDAEVKKDTTAGSSGKAASRAKEGVSVSLGDKATTLTDGLVGYWKMDEASWNGTAGEVKDASGNNNNGVAVSGATTSAGKFGNGGIFDGIDDNSQVASPDFVEDQENISYSVWAKPSVASPVAGILGQAVVNNNQQVFRMYVLANRNFAWQVYNTNGDSSSLQIGNQFSDGNWHHFVGVYRKGVAELYVDGKFFSKGSAITGKTRAGGSGQHFDMGSNWPGYLDEARAYNRALSPDEVRRLYEYAPAPVMHLKMDEKVSGDAKTLNDISGNNNTGTTSDGANDAGMDCAVPGKYGTACKFDGVDDGVSMGDVTFLDGLQGFTVGYWMKTSGMSIPNASYVVAKSGAADTTFYFQMNTFEQFSFTVRNSSNVSVQTNASDVTGLVDMNWHYISGVYDGANIMLYVDGVKKSSAPHSGGNKNCIYPLNFGNRDDSSQFFSGSLDDVKIYNYARTQEQILEDMGAGAPATKIPVLDLNFDEGQGATAYDKSVNKNNGTLNSSTTGTNTTTTAMWDKGGKFGGAMEFDGTDDVVTNASFKYVSANQFSMSQFINIKTLATGKPIIGQWGSSQNNILLKLDNTNNDELRICIASTLTDACTNYGATTDLNLAINQWRNVQVVYDGVGSANANKLKLYIDGVQKTLAFTGTIPATIQSASTAGISIGGNSGDYTNFSMDELKIYSYAIGEDEIKTLHNGGSAMSLGGESATANNNGATVTGEAAKYCIPGDTAKCDKPVLELKMDEKSGTTAFDTSGNGNNGTLTGGPTWDRGKNGSALKFDGVDDYVDIADNNSLDLNANMTLSLWVKAPLPSGANALIAKGNLGSNINYGISIESGKIYFYTQGTANANWSTNVTASTYCMSECVITATYDGANKKVFINGVELASVATTGAPSVNNTNFRIGWDGGIYHYSGVIDDVKIYNYARTSAQVAWDYNRGKEINLWKFDEGTGATAHDEGASQNTGTITGATWTNESECKNGKCLNFNGVGQTRVTANTQDNMSIFSTCSWINASALTNAASNPEMVIFSKGWWLVLLTDGKLRFQLLTNAAYPTVTALESININQWYRVCSVSNGIGVAPKIFINGINKSGTTANGSGTQIDDSARALSIGSSDSNIWYGNFYGYIDEPKIYNYALTAEQVKQDYNGGVVNFR